MKRLSALIIQNTIPVSCLKNAWTLNNGKMMMCHGVMKKLLLINLLACKELMHWLLPGVCICCTDFVCS